MYTTNPIIAEITNMAPKGIHNGAVTHHQLQVATTPIPASLSVKKIKNRIVPKPKPVDLLFFSMP
jgi:hypothetical protein